MMKIWMSLFLLSLMACSSSSNSQKSQLMHRSKPTLIVQSDYRKLIKNIEGLYNNEKTVHYNLDKTCNITIPNIYNNSPGHVTLLINKISDEKVSIESFSKYHISQENLKTIKAQSDSQDGFDQGLYEKALVRQIPSEQKELRKIIAQLNLTVL